MKTLISIGKHPSGNLNSLIRAAFMLTLVICLPVTMNTRLQAADQFQWPVPPFNQSHVITGNFCEYRSTTNPAHFHNGIDIPNPDGQPVYPVKNGTVDVIDPVGDAAYVRVDDIAYVHVLPNPALHVGDPVTAGVTVLGTTISGQGHVHLTYGYVGGEKNALLPSSGLTPFTDTWAPIIRYVNFYKNNSPDALPDGVVSGKVDIVVKVDEQNGPPGSSSSVLNNGTYRIGYRVLSADTATVVYEPPSNGLRFSFDTKPANSLVDIVYFKTLSSTSSHVYQVTNDIVRDNFWDTTTLPEGDYVVMVFTEDTRQNADTAYVPVTVLPVDDTPPAQPVFKYVQGTADGMRLGWYPNSESDLAGYRLYFSFDNVSWSLFKDENIFTAGVTDTLLKQVLNSDVYFFLTAVDNSPQQNESIPSDIYGMSNGKSYLDKVLVVDGFDRTDGAYTQPFHSFVYKYGTALTDNKFSFDTVPNESITDSLVDLSSYAAVFWFVGDDAVGNETFSSAEQALIKHYLENGGSLFVNGAHIAWDLDGNTDATAEDRQFLHDYFKVSFVKQAPGSKTVSGAGDPVFEGLDFQYGDAAYAVDSADVVTPAGEGGLSCLEYNDTLTAGVCYQGLFGSGLVPGKLVYAAFPFETIGDSRARQDITESVLRFFFPTTSVDAGRPAAQIPADFALLPNYPNPFNPATTIRFTLPRRSRAQLTVFDLQGKIVARLLDKDLSPGEHTLQFDASELASGVYFYELSAGSFRQVRKMMLLK